MRLHESKKEGGRWLASIKDCVDASVQGLEEYVKKSKNSSCAKYQVMPWERVV